MVERLVLYVGAYLRYSEWEDNDICDQIAKELTKNRKIRRQRSKKVPHATTTFRKSKN